MSAVGRLALRIKTMGKLCDKEAARGKTCSEMDVRQREGGEWHIEMARWSAERGVKEEDQHKWGEGKFEDGIKDNNTLTRNAGFA